MKQHCFRCRMSFRVEKPSKPTRKARPTTVARCPECNLRFWHGSTHIKGKDVVTIGIFPADAKRIEP